MRLLPCSLDFTADLRIYNTTVNSNRADESSYGPNCESSYGPNYESSNGPNCESSYGPNYESSYGPNYESSCESSYISSYESCESNILHSTATILKGFKGYVLHL